jgi:stage II sporulation protein D
MKFSVFAVYSLLAAALLPAGAAPVEILHLDSLEVRLLYGADEEGLHIGCLDTIILSADDRAWNLSPGSWRFTVSRAVPARSRHHVYAETFLPGEKAEMTAAVAAWTAKGYAPEPVPFGRIFVTPAGRRIDNRVFWLSLARAATLPEAEKIRDRLAEGDNPKWAWIRPETIAPGQATVLLRDGAGAQGREVFTPFTLEALKPLELRRADRKKLLVSGPLTVDIDADGRLALRGRLPLEEYLAMVLPAEMPPSWPAEALAAQAVAARSEVLAALAGKHHQQGFDFCIKQHCRAFTGLSGKDARTTAALARTAGEALITPEGRIMQTVFSACCGGWTENNENVWAAPPRPELRGTPDMPEKTGPDPAAETAAFLKQPPFCYCGRDRKGFRWERRYTQRELEKAVNRHYAAGSIEAIECGDRGVSGRLKWIRIRGSGGVFTVHKELPIRQTLGGLPSALFILHTEGSGHDARTWVFSGGGRGHGVGLCQHGACGMAETGKTHHEILRHYFTGAKIERLD